MTQPLLTFDDIAEWQARLAHIVREEECLATEKAGILKKLEAVMIIFGSIPKAVPESSEPLPVDTPDPPATRNGAEKPSWPAEIVRIFEALKGPLTYEELKDELDKGDLHGEFEQGNKGFYNAVTRLQKKKYLTKHRGWLFRIADLAAHMAKVSAGEAEEVKDFSGGPERPSPMADKIKVYLESAPNGASSVHIIAYLKRDERFTETLRKNTSGAYNVIARLVSRGEIRKEGGLLYFLKENGLPKGSPDAGGVSAPSELPARDIHGNPTDIFS